MTATQEKKPNWQPTNTPYPIKKVHIYIPEFMHMSLGEGTGNNFWGDELNSSGTGGRDGEENMVISGGQCGQPTVVVHYIAGQ